MSRSVDRVADLDDLCDGGVDHFFGDGVGLGLSSDLGVVLCDVGFHLGSESGISSFLGETSLLCFLGSDDRSTDGEHLVLHDRACSLEVLALGEVGLGGVDHGSQRVVVDGADAIDGCDHTSANGDLGGQDGMCECVLHDDPP